MIEYDGRAVTAGDTLNIQHDNGSVVIVRMGTPGFGRDRIEGMLRDPAWTLRGVEPLKSRLPNVPGLYRAENGTVWALGSADGHWRRLVPSDAYAPWEVELLAPGAMTHIK